jgi:hypothetical protein
VNGLEQLVEPEEQRGEDADVSGSGRDVVE